MQRARTIAVWIGLIVGVVVVSWWLQQPRGPGDSSETLLWLAALVVLVALLALVVVAIRRLSGTQQSLRQMGRSRARRVEERPDTRFDDIGGNEVAKDRLRDVVDFLRDPETWQAAGTRAPRGVLLEGPPGTGKTHMARAVAGEAGVAFFEASGSEFVELFVGVGPARVRDLFEQAEKAAPAVIFIDELDAIGRRRGTGAVQFNEEREQSLNQILTSMDGFRQTERVVVIGATNRADILDPALVRPGRFDVLLSLPELTPNGRREVLAIHARGKVLADEVDLERWIERTAGATGATVAHLLNEAALLAVRQREARGGVAAIHEADLEQAWGALQVTPGGLSPLDKALVGSAWHLVRPEQPVTVRAVLGDGRTVQGRLLWADGAFLKLRAAAGHEIAIAKRQIATLETVA